ncbi:MAG: hypothetical protein GJ676_01515 [Rhodobacteraceae bacterium]|nr:hypothetical protein [Paracoccaceae bacterium]
MLDYGQVVYLDPQKTGTTFVAEFLRDHLDLECLCYRKHKPVRGRLHQNAFHFISVRNPVDQYVSLYKYGLKKGGRLRRRLYKNGLDDLYEGSPQSFNAWLEKILHDPEVATYVKDGYENVDRNLIGLQSFRFLSLSFQYPLPLLKIAQKYQDVRSTYDEHRLHSHVIRLESLNKDLANLFRGPLAAYAKNKKTALKELKQLNRINSTENKGIGRKDISTDNLSAICEAERFLLELYYPEELKPMMSDEGSQIMAKAA